MFQSNQVTGCTPCRNYGAGTAVNGFRNSPLESHSPPRMSGRACTRLRQTGASALSSFSASARWRSASGFCRLAPEHRPGGSMSLEQLAARLRKHVEALASMPRPPGSPEHTRAAAYIRDHLRVAGFTVRETEQAVEGFPCRNLLTEPLPHDERLPLVIIGAHYDSIPGSPGADDNASAVAALLELAAWVGPRLPALGPCRARLQLVAYDLEEYGLVGSTLHAQELRGAGAAVRGMASLEMLGYTDQRPGSQNLPRHLRGLYPDVGNFIGVC